VLSRYLDAIAVRTHEHAELEAWAERAGDDSVINASPRSIRVRRSPMR
jgi:ornithine carbamoyltransferase